jgi:hypothetical protein
MLDVTKNIWKAPQAAKTTAPKTAKTTAPKTTPLTQTTKGIRDDLNFYFRDDFGDGT